MYIVMSHRKHDQFVSGFTALIALCILATGCTRNAGVEDSRTVESLRQALTFYASFDGGVEADGAH
jgi:hypothetical protein